MLAQKNINQIVKKYNFSFFVILILSYFNILHNSLINDFKEIIKISFVFIDIIFIEKYLHYTEKLVQLL